MSEEISQLEVNKAVRKLRNSAPMKMTVMIHRYDGTILELQADAPPTIHYLEAVREIWLMFVSPPPKGDYGDRLSPLCRMSEVEAVTHEINPT